MSDRERGRLPAINQRVTLRRGPEERAYTSTVQEVGAGVLAVAAPTEEGGSVSVRPGERWQLRYFDEHAEYRVEAQTVSLSDQPVRLLWLSLPESVTAIQRRRHVRLDLRLQIRLRSEDETLAGKTLDLSAGGFRALLERKPAADADYDAELMLPDGKVNARVRLARRGSFTDARGESHSAYALAFTSIEERVQDRIVRLIFREQRRRRRLGQL